jgi:hypothetical protein
MARTRVVTYSTEDAEALERAIGLTNGFGPLVMPEESRSALRKLLSRMREAS